MAADTDWEALNPGLNDLEVVEMDAVADIGDGTFWVRVSGFAPEGGLLVDDQVAIRVDSVRAFLRVVAIFPGETERSIYSDEVERWARLLSERIIDTLASGMGP
jgi:hypothetical protein